MSESPYEPVEPSADGDRTSQVPPPRYSASASVPLPPGMNQPGAQPPPGLGQPGLGQPGLGQPGLGQPGLGQPGLGQPGEGPSGLGQPGMGQASPYGQGYGSFGQPPPGAGYPTNDSHGGTAPRVAASASVPAPPSFGQPPPPAMPPSTPYGGQPTGYPAQGFAQQGGQYGGVPSSGPPGTYGATPERGTMPTGMGQGGFQPSYGQPPPDPSWQNAPAQSGGWQEEPPPRKSRRGLIITLVIAAIVVVVGIGGYVGWSLTNSGSQFTVGTCVKQDGTSAVTVDCGTDGAFEIKSVVETETGCPDASQPSLVLTELGGGRKYACLAPTAG